MKVKTSITLSEDLLADIDAHADRFKNRSDFLEEAARAYLARLAREEIDRRDLEIINANADALNDEALDVLAYQTEP